MLISPFETMSSAAFKISRTDDGVDLHLSYELSGTSAPDDSGTIYDGSMDAALGEDHAGTSQTSEASMTVSFSATLKDGVTEIGSYEIADAGDDGGSLVFDFDVTTFSTAADFKAEGALSHFVFGSAEADAIEGAEGADVLRAGAGDDTVKGGDGDDRLSGRADDDEVHGGDGHDAIRGGDGADSLFGDEGDDKIVGGDGADQLTGGAGADAFIFNGALDAADTILDFTSGEDRIRLDHAVFTALEKGGLGEGAFVANDDGVATDAAQRLIYDTVKGELFYDADGSGAGEAVLIATLGPGVALTADDIGVF